MFPPGSPFEQFFKDFMNRNRPARRQGGNGDKPAPARRAQSLGSGFIIDPAGYRGHQQPRDRRRRRNLGHPAGQHHAEGDDRRPRRERRHRAAEGEVRQAAADGAIRRFSDSRASATGCWRSATRSASAAPSPPASSRPAAATSSRARTTTSSRPTPRSTAATPAARCSTWTAR